MATKAGKKTYGSAIQFGILKKKFKEALSGCMRCEYEEADGALENHCAECQRKVTQLAWRVFVKGENP